MVTKQQRKSGTGLMMLGFIFILLGSNDAELMIFGFILIGIGIVILK